MMNKRSACIDIIGNDVIQITTIYKQKIFGLNKRKTFINLITLKEIKEEDIARLNPFYIIVLKEDMNLNINAFKYEPADNIIEVEVSSNDINRIIYKTTIHENC